MQLKFLMFCSNQNRYTRYIVYRCQLVRYVHNAVYFWFLFNLIRRPLPKTSWLFPLLVANAPIIFGYHIFFLVFRGPLETPVKIFFSHMKCRVSKKVERVCGVNFWIHFRKKQKMKKIPQFHFPLRSPQVSKLVWSWES